MKIVTVEQMVQLEQECAKIGLPSEVLMENAGKAIADEVGRILGAIGQQQIVFMIHYYILAKIKVTDTRSSTGHY